jgi:anti-sigma regulatory factor (Ser/Thr protein kinase)
VSASAEPHCGFLHEALFYADPDELLEGTVPFLRAGLEAGEAILVAMPRSSLRILRGELNGETEHIQFVDMEELGRNPARIISAWHDFLDVHLVGERGVRGIGEPIWAGRSAPEMEECERHEALLNLAFADAPAWSLLCPYNVAVLDERVLRSAEHNHPLLSHAGARRKSDAYVDPLPYGPFAGELAAPAGVVAGLSFEHGQLATLRAIVAEHARNAALDELRVEALVLAVSEVATNSLLHGGGSGTLTLWRDARQVGCDIRDRGCIDEPLLGRRRPRRDRSGGRGVWLANQLCDLVQIRSTVGGNLVRLQMAVGP